MSLALAATLFNDVTRDSIANNFVIGAYRFYTKSLFSIRSKVISYATLLI